MGEDEYELVPINPIRKMEKRLEKLEKVGGGISTVQELVEIVKINQQVVDDIVKINSDLVNKVSSLSTAVDNLSGKINDFMERIEIAGEERTGATESFDSDKIEKKLDERLGKIEKRMNSMILSRVPKDKWKQMVRRAV